MGVRMPVTVESYALVNKSVVNYNMKNFNIATVLF